MAWPGNNGTGMAMGVTGMVAWQGFLMAFAHGMEVAAVGIGTMETFGAGRERALAWPDEDCAVRR